jgi:hypothetical protein
MTWLDIELLMFNDIFQYSFIYCTVSYFHKFTHQSIPIQWNLCNATPEFSDVRHPTKIYDSKVFLLTKIKSEYSYILYNSTHFPGRIVCRIKQVQLY